MSDFTGFTFGNVNTSDLGIIRVSSGDRYEEELHPEIKDITADVEGVDGQYYFGSNYGTKKIDLNFAFDSIDEEKFRKIRKVFGTTKIKQLIFDELPYKYYMAKLESPVELSYVCFDEPKKHIVGIAENDKRYGVRVVNREPITETVVDEETQEETEVEVGYEIERERIYPYELDEGTQRIYKGEGKISFICYFPFAKSVYKVLPEGSEEWAISSGILSVEDYASIDKYNTETGVINVYNAGDVETGFRLYIPSAALSNTITLTYRESSAIDTVDILTINPVTLKTGDIGILIDTNNGLIVGVTSISTTQDGNTIYTTSGNLYNEYVNSGFFFHLKPNDRYDNATITITGGAQGIEIFYDYLYF